MSDTPTPTNDDGSLTISEDMFKFLIRSAGRVVHINECARMQWKAGNPTGAVVFYDRSDAEMGRVFNRLEREHPGIAGLILAAAAEANEGK